MQHERAMSGYLRAVWQGLTWRSVALAQLLALLMASLRWLEVPDRGTRVHLLPALLIGCSVVAVSAQVAAFAADHAIGRGAARWRSFGTALLVVSVLAASLEYCWGRLDLAAGISSTALGRATGVLFNTAALVGVAMMSYLNRRSVARILGGLRAAQLQRVEAEGRVLASRRAAAEAHFDPAEVLRQLADIRDLYRAGEHRAEARLAALIDELRARVARAAHGSRAAAREQRT